MSREEILESLKEVITMVKPNLDLSTVTESSSLVTDLGIDSLSMLLLSLGVENKFGFQFEQQVVFNTVGEVVDYIEKVI